MVICDARKMTRGIYNITGDMMKAKINEACMTAVIPFSTFRMTVQHI